MTYIRYLFGRYGFLFTGAACLLLGYLLVWQRGLYVDDYSVRSQLINPVTGESAIDLTSRFFPLRMIPTPLIYISVVAVPKYEFLVRLLTTLCIGLNAWLLGLVIYRAVHSKLVAVIGGWLFLAPVFAWEATLWISAEYYISSATFGLLFLLFYQNSLLSERQHRKFLILSTISFTLMLLNFEGLIAIIGIAFLLSLVQTAREPSLTYRNTLKQSLRRLIWPAVVAVIFLFISRYSPLLALRGGLDVNPVNVFLRSYEYLRHLIWMTAYGGAGRKFLLQAFLVGLSVVMSSWTGIALFCLACLLLLMTVATWRRNEQDFAPTYRVGLTLFFVGVAWAIVTILVPGVFVNGQVLEFRMLYFPTAGGSVAVAAAAWMALKYLGRYRRFKRWDKLLVGLAGLILLVNSIIMLGYCQLFAQRYEEDQRQVSAVRQILAPQSLPPDTYLILYNFDEHSLPDAPVASRVIFGVFETPWSASSALNAAYRRTDLKAIATHRWARMQVRYDTERPPDERLQVQGYPAPVEKTLMLTYQNGSAYLVEDLTIVKSDGSEYDVQFPLARDLIARGVPSISKIKVAE
jgi:hypothetical protein